MPDDLAALPSHIYNDFILQDGYITGAGMCDVYYWTTVLINENSHKPSQDKVRAILGILSATQYMLLNYAPLILSVVPPEIAATAYLIKSLADTINQSIELNDLLNKLTFEGWLEDSLLELMRYKQLKENYQIQLEKAEANYQRLSTPFLKKHWFKKTESIQSKINELEQKIELLSTDIEARSVVYITDNNNDLRKTSIDARQNIISNIARKINAPKDIKRFLRFDKAKNDFDLSATPEQIQRNEMIQKNCEGKAKEKAIELSISTFSAIGAGLLLASIFYPPLFIPGAIMTAAVSVISMYYTSKRVMSTATEGPKLTKHSNSFFSVNVKENPKEMRYFHANLAARM